MAHGDARKEKWRQNRRMEWVSSTLHTTSEHGVSSITTADVHTSVASSRLNWNPRWFKWTRPFRRKTKSGFCACAITISNAVFEESSEMTGQWLLFRQTTRCHIARDIIWYCCLITYIHHGMALFKHACEKLLRHYHA